MMVYSCIQVNIPTQNFKTPLEKRLHCMHACMQMQHIILKIRTTKTVEKKSVFLTDKALNDTTKSRADATENRKRKTAPVWAKGEASAKEVG